MKVKIETFQKQAGEVHQKLDEMVEATKSTLTDLEVEIGHDVNNLTRKFEGSLKGSGNDGGSSSEGKCLNVRAELVECYNTLGNTGECQIFVQKLDKCVTEALKQ